MQSGSGKIRNAVAATAIVLIASACADNRSAYEAYVACDAAIAAAEEPADIMSCYTKKWRPWFQAKDEDGENWFAEFKASRPRISRLHEEQLVDDNDKSILSIVGYARTGQPADIGVNMRREGHRWRIDYEEVIAKGLIGTDSRPIHVTLGPVDGPEWYPGELAVGFGRGADGRCRLSIYHVVRYPELTVVSVCESFTKPGTVSLEELMPEGEETSESIPVKFFDHRHYARRVEDGDLTITTVDDGRLSGEFRFLTVSGSSELSIAGTFTNVPFEQ